MNRKRGKKEVLKGTLAIGLLINQFSSFGAIVNATVYESEVENNSDIVQESIDSSQDDLPDLDGNLSNESTENEEIQNPGDGLPEEIPNDEEFGETEDVELEIPKVEEDLDSADGSEESKSPEEQIEEELLEETASINLEDDGLFSIESRSSGSGLVQLWQVVPDGQQSKEGKTTSEIMKALQCKPNHNLYPSGGQSEHNTYVNSCYVDDALYLGEDTNYYYIYLSGYEGKVPKSESHWFELDLNNDGTKVKYEIQTVAYYIPGGTTMYSLQEKTEPLDVPELNYYDQYLDKYNDINERGITTFSTSTVQSPSYYANENGTLVHYLTSNVTKANSYSKVIVGKAPSWMSSNVKYYSYDGIYFYTNWRNIKVNGQGAVNQSNPFYNYYQYLPVRSKSNYSANIFDNYTNSNGGAGGKLVNTGQYFYAVQDNYGINGALQYAMGIHESGWGKSSLSIDKNNLFGMNATDNNPYGNGTSFPSVEAGINYHADRYLSWGYTDPVDDWRYMGSHVGNKGSGMNVRYASDPFWGEKIAGWYYRFDSVSGLKDYDYYTIGIKQSNAVVDVKSQANSSSSTLYQTKNKKSNIKIYNYPFLITGEQNGYYCVKTDTPIVNGKPVFNGTYSWGLTNGYILKSEINILNHSLYRNPVDSRSNVISAIGNIIIEPGRINIDGWAFIEGLSINNVDDISTTLLLKDLRGDIIKSYPTTVVFRPDVTMVYGEGKYNYSFSGFQVSIPEKDLVDLSSGNYSLELQMNPKYFNEKVITLSAGDLVSTGQYQHKKVQLKDVENKLILNLTHEEISGVNNIIVNQSNVLFNGFSFIKGLNISTTSDSQKKVVINNKTTGQQVYSGPVDNIKREDVTQAYGNGKYNYDYAGFLVDLPMSVLDTLMIGEYEIVMNVTQGKVTETISLIGPEKQASYIGPNGKVTLSVNGKQMSIKVEPVTYEKVSGVNNIIVNQSNVLFNGFSFIKGLNISTTSDSQKKVVINNKMTGQQVYSGPADNIKREDVTQAYGNGKYN
ncbi:hypothetical protein GMA28_13920, partial [Turicibacter sanguinis]|nr:hypothetical protein [Turicibacter sanguinis]